MEQKPKILLYDLETAPIVATVWGKYEQDIIWTIQEWYVLCFSYKWLGESKTHVVAQVDFPDYKPGSEDDRRVVAKLHELLDEADVVVAHNGNRFDNPKSRARMIAHGLTPPSPFKQVDTKLVAKSQFGFTSNKLDDLGEYLGVGHKLATGGHHLWKQCMAGDKKAWAKMKRYNKQDVVLLEKVYLALRPWMNNHPSLARLTDSAMACPKCGTVGRLQRRGWSVTNVGKYRRLQCQSCGGWSKERTALGKNEDVRPSFASI